jgi:hypothetical protein
MSKLILEILMRYIHLFVYLDTAMTERELVESTMERVSWWKCLIPIWCIVDYVGEKKQAGEQIPAQTQAEAAQAADAEKLQAYINQC